MVDQYMAVDKDIKNILDATNTSNKTGMESTNEVTSNSNVYGQDVGVDIELDTNTLSIETTRTHSSGDL